MSHIVFVLSVKLRNRVVTALQSSNTYQSRNFVVSFMTNSAMSISFSLNSIVYNVWTHSKPLSGKSGQSAKCKSSIMFSSTASMVSGLSDGQSYRGDSILCLSSTNCSAADVLLADHTVEQHVCTSSLDVMFNITQYKGVFQAAVVLQIF